MDGQVPRLRRMEHHGRGADGEAQGHREREALRIVNPIAEFSVLSRRMPKTPKKRGQQRLMMAWIYH